MVCDSATRIACGATEFLGGWMDDHSRMVHQFTVHRHQLRSESDSKRRPAEPAHPPSPYRSSLTLSSRTKNRAVRRTRGTRDCHPPGPPRCPPSAPSARSRTSHASCRPVAASLALAARSTWSYDASLYASTLAQRCVLALHPSACRHAALTALSRRLSRPSHCVLTDGRSLTSSQGSCARLRASPGMILGSTVRASRVRTDGMRLVARFAGGAECGRLARGRGAVARPRIGVAGGSRARLLPARVSTLSTPVGAKCKHT